MKLKHAIILVSAWIIFSTCGCPPRPRPADKVVLPSNVTGTWKARGLPWKIVIAADGTLSSAVIDLGPANVKPNQVTKVKMKDGQFSTYKAGDCIVGYTPATRELFVSVEMESIHIVYQDAVIDGNSTDRFVGPVSQDGKQWTPDWIKVFDYGPRFPQDPNKIRAQPLVFDKVED